MERSGGVCAVWRGEDVFFVADAGLSGHGIYLSVSPKGQVFSSSELLANPVVGLMMGCLVTVYICLSLLQARSSPPVSCWLTLWSV